MPSVGLDDIEIGDTLEVESPSGKKRELEFAGTVHDMTAFPTFMSGAGNGYITFDTLEWMGEPRDYNQMVFVVEEQPRRYRSCQRGRQRDSNSAWKAAA